MTTTSWKSLVVVIALAAGSALAQDSKNRVSTVPSAVGRDLNDGFLTMKVKGKLATTKGVEATEVRVDSYDGVVSLAGTVDSPAQKQAVERAVRDVNGVRDVKSMLKVGPATAKAGGGDETRARGERSITGAGGRGGADEAANDLADLRTSAAVKLRLLTASEVPATDINVDVDDGVVYLFGVVPTEATKKAAEAEAKKTDGVTRIDNQLQVVPTNKMETVSGNDSDLQRDVNLRFKRRTGFEDIETVVEGGVVRLKGKVDTQWDQIAALRLARSVPGVKGVQNLLEVKDPQAPGDPGAQDRRY